MAAEERRQLVEKAHLAEQSFRYADMVEAMNKVVKQGKDLNVQERNLLAAAYKHFVGAKRASWRVVCVIEERIVGANPRRRELSREYRKKIEREMKDSCNELLGLVDKYLMSTKDIENKIFYLKLKGDYFRYLAEFSTDSVDNEVFVRAKETYDEALELSKDHLGPANPIRLGLILNSSVFYFEILNAYEAAISLVKSGLAQAQEEINHVPPHSKGDSVVILQLLKDNLKIWTTELDEITRNSKVR